MPLRIPERLQKNCCRTPELAAWLAQLPETLDSLRQRWSLTLEHPFEGATCAWVAPARLTGGTVAVLKLGMPHMEAEHEAAGLQFWNGDPAIRLLRSDDQSGAMLLEHANPVLRSVVCPNPSRTSSWRSC